MLHPSSRIAFSAGTGSLDPYGFRVMEPGVSPLEELARLDPTLLPWLFTCTPLMINAYPATLDPVPGVCFTDTYLSCPTAVRALRLAALQRAPAILVAQPLLVAEILLRLRAAGGPLPPKLLVATGGYPLPRSLLRAFAGWMVGVDLRVAELYGIAEVDAACLVSVATEGPPVWYPRRDIDVLIDDAGGLALGRAGKAAFRSTGDRAWLVGEGLRIQSGRVGASTAAELEGWGEAEWAGGTGYRVSGRWVPRSDASRVDWTVKPDWR